MTMLKFMQGSTAAIVEIRKTCAHRETWRPASKVATTVQRSSRFSGMRGALLLIIAFVAWSQANTQVHARTLNAREAGVIGDGISDDTAALQAALDALREGGGTLYLPSGRYRITNSIRPHSKTRIVGDGASTELFCGSAGWTVEQTDHFGLITIKKASSVEVSTMRLRGTTTATLNSHPKIHLFGRRAEHLHPRHGLRGNRIRGHLAGR